MYQTLMRAAAASLLLLLLPGVDELVQLGDKFVENIRAGRHQQEGWPNSMYGEHTCTECDECIGTGRRIHVVFREAALLPTHYVVVWRMCTHRSRLQITDREQTTRCMQQ
jgi:hypothetical protein